MLVGGKDTTMEQPIVMRWDGDAMIPTSSYWATRADRVWVVGAEYQIVEHHDRSSNSHRHYFAAIADGWRNIPDELLDEYPTAEHLRKKALIAKRYADQRDHVCDTKVQARKLRAFIKPLDQYAVIEVRECVVRVYTAQSQSTKAMGAKAFQQSKQDVLDFIDDLLGVARGDVAANAGMAA